MRRNNITIEKHRLFYISLTECCRAAEDLVLSIGSVRAAVDRLLDARLDLLIHYPQKARPDIGSSTACFECGATVKTEHVWLKKSDPNVALCEGCFRTAETTGRAKEGSN